MRSKGEAPLSRLSRGKVRNGGVDGALFGGQYGHFDRDIVSITALVRGVGGRRDGSDGGRKKLANRSATRLPKVCTRRSVTYRKFWHPARLTAWPCEPKNCHSLGDVRLLRVLTSTTSSIMAIS
ncbi:hypothetical protein E2C01_070137 [Portunus trituberculatus]|uniref:Uncharacterized protein n=1 Tax=Portunus trituberculatus TaxID=210409 RepID=A0A5B7I0I4_PORTR|nr:hypothetical protein [Portunus trituberculatus]